MDPGYKCVPPQNCGTSKKTSEAAKEKLIHSNVGKLTLLPFEIVENVLDIYVQSDDQDLISRGLASLAPCNLRCL